MEPVSFVLLKIHRRSAGVSLVDSPFDPSLRYEIKVDSGTDPTEDCIMIDCLSAGMRSPARF